MTAASTSSMARVTGVVATEISLVLTLVALVRRISGSLIFVLLVPAVSPLAAVPPRERKTVCL